MKEVPEEHSYSQPCLALTGCFPLSCGKKMGFQLFFFMVNVSDSTSDVFTSQVNRQ